MDYMNWIKNKPIPKVSRQKKFHKEFNLFLKHFMNKLN